MKQWIVNNRLYFIGALTGGLGGFLYWKYIGCLDGTCSITSSPVNSTLYFAFFGAIIFGTFRKKKAETEK